MVPGLPRTTVDFAVRPIVVALFLLAQDPRRLVVCGSRGTALLLMLRSRCLVELADRLLRGRRDPRGVDATDWPGFSSEVGGDPGGAVAGSLPVTAVHLHHDEVVQGFGWSWRGMSRRTKRRRVLASDGRRCQSQNI
jgi:hypothetical protein